MRDLRLREVKGKVFGGSEGGRGCRAGSLKWVLGDPGFAGLPLSDACGSLRVQILSWTSLSNPALRKAENPVPGVLGQQVALQTLPRPTEEPQALQVFQRFGAIYSFSIQGPKTAPWALGSPDLSENHFCTRVLNCCCCCCCMEPDVNSRLSRKMTLTTYFSECFSGLLLLMFLSFFFLANFLLH